MTIRPETIAGSTPPAAPIERPVCVRTGRLDGVTMEGAFAVSARVRELRAAGADVADLSIGEPAFPTPPHVVEAALRALAAGDSRYAPPAGLPELREGIATALRARGVGCRSTQVVVTPGAKTALLYSFLALVEAGSEVLIPDPGFPTYASLARLAGGVPIPYRSLGSIGRLITRRTRLLVLNLPNNPTGIAASPEQLECLAALVLREDLMVISDEIYACLWYGTGGSAPSIAAIPEMAPRTVVVDGFSKTWAMTGWRLGFAAVPSALAPALERLAVNGHSCVPAFVQRAGIAALRGPDESLREMVTELRRRRDLVIAGLNRIDGVDCATPAGAFYAFPDLSRPIASAGFDAETFAAHLLDAWGVAAVPGTAFGAAGEGHVRISFAGSADAVPIALERIAGCVRSLTPNSGRLK